MLDVFPALLDRLMEILLVLEQLQLLVGLAYICLSLLLFLLKQLEPLEGLLFMSCSFMLHPLHLLFVLLYGLSPDFPSQVD